MRFLLITCLTVSSLSFGFGVVSHWLHTPEGKREGEMTQERTRPLVLGDILYMANLSGEVVAYHRTEGYPLWKVKVEGGVEGGLSYGRSKLIVGDLKGNLYGLNARDGSEAWRFKIAGEWLSPALVHRDKIYVGTSAEEIYALSESQGKEVWHFSHRGDEKMTVRGTSGPTVSGNDIFIGFSDGSVVSLSADKGKVNWTKRLRTRERFYDVDMIVHADDQSVIAGTYDGKIHCLDKLTGNTLWVYPAGSYGGFLVEENRLYFAGMDGNFYALDRTNSTQIWKTPFKGVGLTPARVGDFLVFSTSSDPVYVVDPKDGKIVWTGDLGTGTLAAAAGGADNWFYVISNYGNLFSFEILKNRVEKKGPSNVPLFSATTRSL
jgi:outer membrane protein assembly factor BamB